VLPLEYEDDAYLKLAVQKGQGGRDAGVDLVDTTVDLVDTG
jgi:hypothetical protein